MNLKEPENSRDAKRSRCETAMMNFDTMWKLFGLVGTKYMLFLVCAQRDYKNTITQIKMPCDVYWERKTKVSVTFFGGEFVRAYLGWEIYLRNTAMWLFLTNISGTIIQLQACCCYGIYSATSTSHKLVLFSIFPILTRSYDPCASIKFCRPFLLLLLLFFLQIKWGLCFEMFQWWSTPLSSQQRENKKKNNKHQDVEKIWAEWNVGFGPFATARRCKYISQFSFFVSHIFRMRHAFENILLILCKLQSSLLSARNL